MLRNRIFFLLWRRDPSGFGAAISDAIARSSIVLRDSVCANRIVMAASRLLGAAAGNWFLGEIVILKFQDGWGDQDTATILSSKRKGGQRF